MSKLLLAAVVSFAACKSPRTDNSPPDQDRHATTATASRPAVPETAHLPWEKHLVLDASFVLNDEYSSEQTSAVVIDIRSTPTTRTYRLKWSDMVGPELITVTHQGVIVGDENATLASMKKPHNLRPDTICYGPDISEEECGDICDAEICLSQTKGIVRIFGQFAPNGSEYVAR